MEITWSVFVVIVGAALVTFVPRVLPLMVLSRFELPAWAMRWLGHIPIAVMAALVGQELLGGGGSFNITRNVDLLAGILTFFVAVKTRSLLLTVLFGVICALVLRFVMI
ncbi:branched-chain amino acid ABC transporter [Cohnella kolymensis]|uniref:Branched-chain amino acid ABC transporter n=1 Tax=Cohnella kolymensis TaxID=1590652 RepID=A0ABR5A8P1_9BACL|nr:AzlD domain-containing protein [Cohnella kolymensis]KIL37038.1 branched-chain amino acid ABC transporter [Cohnella kolymensis]